MFIPCLAPKFRSAECQNLRFSDAAFQPLISKKVGACCFRKIFLGTNIGQDRKQKSVFCHENDTLRRTFHVVCQAQDSPSSSATGTVDRDEELGSLKRERQRQLALRPYLVPKAQRGIIGISPEAQRLRSDIKAAWQSRLPVVIEGEDGLGKENIAALIHFGSKSRRQDLAMINAAFLSEAGVELFGKEGKPGILDLVGEGSVLLNNCQEMKPKLWEKIRNMIRTGEYYPVGSSKPRWLLSRLFFATERPLSNLDGLDVQLIEVEPLRDRRDDIELLADFWITFYSRQRKMRRPRLSPDAAMWLRERDYPLNIVELTSLLKRAMTQWGTLPNPPPELSLSILVGDDELSGSEAVKQERRRQKALLPYLVPRTERGIIGITQTAQKIRADIKLASMNDKPILILGERGLGKVNVAALIHYGSSRRRQDLIAVNCAVLSDSAQELTGRYGGAPGLLELVGPGSVLLYNLQDASLKLRLCIKDLMVSQQYRRVGEPADIPPRPLQTRMLVAMRTLLPEFERINVQMIDIAPLRTRPDDIKVLADFLLSRYCRENGLTKPLLTQEAIEWLKSQPLPYNTDELNALVTRAVAQMKPGTTEIGLELFKQVDETAEQRRVILRTYLVPRAERGIVGNSRYAKKLREDIQKAQRCDDHVLIFGEPGLGKDNIAALVHYGSARRRQEIIKVNCNTITDGSELFGTSNRPGLLGWLGEGTVVLNNILSLEPSVRDKVYEMMRSGQYFPVGGSTRPASPIQLGCRVILLSERVVSLDNVKAVTIRVPPLRVRRADLEAQVDYYLGKITRRQRIPKPKIAYEALRWIQRQDFPNNLTELQQLIERALVQAGGDVDELDAEVFWPEGALQQNKTKIRRFRINLLDRYPAFREFLKTDWFPDRFNYYLVAPIFAVTVATLFLGPQDRDHNMMLNVFWAWWWPVICIVFPLLGRIWCSICPFMIYGELLQKLSLALFPRSLGKWPRDWADKWGGWVLYAGFFAILTWEEVWDLSNTAYLSAWLLLLITGGAVVFSQFFERRFWCRYLCPIGGMNGLYAKLAVTELRAQQPVCSANCTTYQCYKGGPQKGEGLETLGCPLYSHPAQLEDNKDCVLCHTCTKACPHRSVEFNLRPPAIELWTTHVPRTYEVALLFLLNANVFLHRLPELLTVLSVPAQEVLSPFWPHMFATLGMLSLPALYPILTHKAMETAHAVAQPKATPRPKPLIDMAYGYLPLTLAGTLAHYLDKFMLEGFNVLQVGAKTFGAPWWQSVPGLTVDNHVVDFCQGAVLLVGVLASLGVTHKIAKQNLNWIIAMQHAAIVGMGASMYYLMMMPAVQ